MLFSMKTWFHHFIAPSDNQVVVHFANIKLRQYVRYSNCHHPKHFITSSRVGRRFIYRWLFTPV